MPKTRNAFALKDFDRARILQRPYFKDFNFDKDLTDEKILSSLSAQIGDSIPELERKNETLSKIYDRLCKYIERVQIHKEKVSYWNYEHHRHNLIKTPESERANFLSEAYLFDIIFPAKTFSLAVKVLWQNLESILHKRYRDRFAERLKEIRKASKLSRRELASKLGYTENGYGKFESGRNEPNLATIINLSRYLNVSTDSLLGLQ